MGRPSPVRLGISAISGGPSRRSALSVSHGHSIPVQLNGQVGDHMIHITDPESARRGAGAGVAGVAVGSERKLQLNGSLSRFVSQLSRGI